jgi:hypothetical protein
MSVRMASLLAVVATTGLALADPLIQTFGVWAANHTYTEKASLYHGWTNGFLSASRYNPDRKRVKRVMDFAECLEKIEYPAAIAIIDQYYKDHPELWNQPLSEMLAKALTSPGTPCEGKDPN